MGEAADDAFHAAMADKARLDMMRDAGARRCQCFGRDLRRECPVCYDLGWIDRDGKPCEI